MRSKSVKAVCTECPGLPVCSLLCSDHWWRRQSHPSCPSFPWWWSVRWWGCRWLGVIIIFVRITWHINEFYLLGIFTFKSWNIKFIKGVLHPWALFLKTLCIFSKNKVTSDKLSYGSGQKYSKELKNHSFTSVETIVVKLQWKNVQKSIFFMFLSHKSITTWVSENSSAVIRFPEMLPIRSISYLLPMCCSFWEKMQKTVQKLTWGAVPP